ncbi:radical S-adenosyl methionine domain-containing protein 1, mitochondrial isoform X1 [Excalfactoria chinensis]|uniref:radical S-adenosyl methionine domain-containing protein 1, mitochondrial isoform X1 n=1 Tax=Excalfactoria chinensis TaxID=46218 RepID=UPI003B3A02A6
MRGSCALSSNETRRSPENGTSCGARGGPGAVRQRGAMAARGVRAALGAVRPRGMGPGRAAGLRAASTFSDPGPEPAGPATAALYVHWPYCRKHCSYCSFNKYVVPAVDEAAVRACLVREAQTLLRLGHVRSITSVFFGGGTPSLASPHTIAAVLEAAAEVAHLPAGAEVTLEANPSSADPARLSGFRAAGINRLSLGVQSLDDAELRLLGRDHTAAEARMAVEAAQKLFPGRTSLDLIFGLPGQSHEAWARGLEAALGLCDDHLALYQLTLERGTALEARVRRGVLPEPPEELLAEMYLSARITLVAAGFHQYEVSNFARKVRRPHLEAPPPRAPTAGAAPPHPPLSYRAPAVPTTSPTGGPSSTWAWGRVSAGAGSGVHMGLCVHCALPALCCTAGAHGRFVPWGEGGRLREARVQTPHPDTWMREVRSCGHGTRRRAALSPLEQLQEVLALGLRTTEGVTQQRWGLFSPRLSLEAAFGASGEARELQERGWMRLDGRALRCTPAGLPVLDSLLPALLCQLRRRWDAAEEEDGGGRRPK